MIAKNEIRKAILKAYSAISLVLVADMVAYYFYRISLNGYYSDVILFWLWLFGSIAIVILFWKKIIAKLLLGAMILALVGSILPMALPFFALVFSTTPFGLRLNKDLNKNYRAQIVGYSVMAYPVLQIIEKKGIVEQQIIQCDDSQLPDNNLELKIRSAKDIIFYL
jgi:cellulose synthase/poly-beta-1,6-N-acetylglucosamine synthase-like glycosyltransferase